MNAPSQNQDGMGSLLYSDGTARFRLWAPSASGVDVVLWDAAGAITTYALANENGTPNWSADGIAAVANTCYQYVITTTPGQDNDTSGPHWRTDARAQQVEGSLETGRGYIVDPALFTTNRTSFTTPPFEDFLIYQLHVGSFTGRNDGLNLTVPTSTFVELKNRLPYIRKLGFNAIELLPISNFQADAGGAGEGYGPSDMFASENLYATSPDQAVSELVQLIDAAHSIGLAVILDLIFNHAAQNNNRYWQYDGNCSGDNGIPGGIYHVHGHHTPWGEGFATWQIEVKNFLLDNARLFLRDYSVDGLRFDAAQAIDPSAVSEIIWSLRNDFPSKYLIAEYNPNDSSTSVAPPQDAYGYLGFCATWNMDSPWRMFDILNSINVVDDLCARIGNFSDPNPWHLVNYLTGSHDQIYHDDSNPNGFYLTQRYGGRLNGYALAKSRLAWALNATLAGTPMLFMGTEGHIDGYWNPWVGWQVDNRLDWLRIGDNLGAPMQRMVTDVNNLRWNHSALRSPAGQITHTDYTNNVVAFKRWNGAGDVLLIVVHAGDGQWDNTQYAVGLDGDSGSWQEIFNSQAPIYGGVNAFGNPGYVLTANDGRLSINLASWSVHVFAKL
jgi:1,4-alpha-glucan branching enzyme